MLKLDEIDIHRMMQDWMTKLLEAKQNFELVGNHGVVHALFLYSLVFVIPVVAKIDKKKSQPINCELS